MLKLSSYFLYTLAVLSLLGGLYITFSGYSPMFVIAIFIIATLFTIGGMVLDEIANIKLHVETQSDYLMAISKRRKNG